MPKGAYGVAVEGVRSVHLVEAPSAWPCVRLALRRVDGDRARELGSEHGDERSRFLLGRVEVLVDRAARRAEIRHGGALDEGDVVHPVLGPIAAAFAQWDGSLPLHAGAFLAADGAWAVIGATQAGKSSLMASLALAGRPVVADDLLVVRPDLTVVAGPRCIDLRPATTAYLGAPTRPSRDGARQRLTLGPVPAEAPLVGWLSLEWGDDHAVTPLAAAERLRVLGASQKAGLVPSDARGLLDLAALPAYRLRRPRTWASVDRTLEELAAAIR